jgi:hypothetical protein
MVVERYQALGVRVSRTDHDGIIASRTDRCSLQVVPDVGPPPRWRFRNAVRWRLS